MKRSKKAGSIISGIFHTPDKHYYILRNTDSELLSVVVGGESLSELQTRLKLLFKSLRRDRGLLRLLMILPTKYSGKFGMNLSLDKERLSEENLKEIGLSNLRGEA